MYVYICMCMYMCLYVYTCMCMSMYKYAYICTCMYMYMYIGASMYMHTRKPKQWKSLAFSVHIHLPASKDGATISCISSILSTKFSRIWHRLLSCRQFCEQYYQELDQICIMGCRLPNLEAHVDPHDLADFVGIPPCPFRSFGRNPLVNRSQKSRNAPTRTPPKSAKSWRGSTT